LYEAGVFAAGETFLAVPVWEFVDDADRCSEAASYVFDSIHGVIVPQSDACDLEWITEFRTCPFCDLCHSSIVAQVGRAFMDEMAVIALEGDSTAATVEEQWLDGIVKDLLDVRLEFRFILFLGRKHQL
jgi:hypothetical protein